MYFAVAGGAESADRTDNFVIVADERSGPDQAFQRLRVDAVHDEMLVFDAGHLANGLFMATAFLYKSEPFEKASAEFVRRDFADFGLGFVQPLLGGFGGSSRSRMSKESGPGVAVLTAGFEEI